MRMFWPVDCVTALEIDRKSPEFSERCLKEFLRYYTWDSRYATKAEAKASIIAHMHENNIYKSEGPGAAKEWESYNELISQDTHISYIKRLGKAPMNDDGGTNDDGIPDDDDDDDDYDDDDECSMDDDDDECSMDDDDESTMDDYDTESDDDRDMSSPAFHVISKGGPKING